MRIGEPADIAPARLDCLLSAASASAICIYVSSTPSSPAKLLVRSIGSLRAGLTALAAGAMICALTGWKSAPLVFETARSVDTSTWPLKLQEAVRHAARADCSGAWTILWPMARRRDPDALSLIADLSLEGLYLPDFKNPAHDQLSLLIYASATPGIYQLRRNSGPTAWRKRGAELVSYRSQSSEAQGLMSCLRSSEAASVCEKLAVKHGFVAPFQSFATEMTSRTVKKSDLIGCVDELRVKGDN